MDKDIQIDLQTDGHKNTRKETDKSQRQTDTIYEKDDRTEKHPADTYTVSNSHKQSILSHPPFKVNDVMIIVLRAYLNDFGEQFVSVISSLGSVHVNHELLDALHEVLLGDHSVDEVQGPQPNRLVLVVQAV